MGEAPDRIQGGPANAIAVEDVRKVMRTQSNYWGCMRNEETDISALSELSGDRMHGKPTQLSDYAPANQFLTKSDVIRLFQSHDLYKTYSMIRLIIYREALSRSFQNEVLAT